MYLSEHICAKLSRTGTEPWVGVRMPAHNLSELMDLLRGLPPGDVPDDIRTEIIGRLENCWHEFSGSQETKMKTYKLSRAEHLVWKPPLLCFEIARHGATVHGSTREHIQHWKINLEQRTANQVTFGFRQVCRTAPRLTEDEMIRIAKRVCDAIQDGPGSNLKSDAHLTWVGETEFRVKPASLIPASGFKQTVEGRRKRMRAILQREIEAIGWVPIAQGGKWLRFRKSDTPS
jgi:hypothetical protein